jgi:hypothetical protein
MKPYFSCSIHSEWKSIFIQRHFSSERTSIILSQIFMHSYHYSTVNSGIRRGFLALSNFIQGNKFLDGKILLKNWFSWHIQMIHTSPLKLLVLFHIKIWSYIHISTFKVMESYFFFLCPLIKFFTHWLHVLCEYFCCCALQFILILWQLNNNSLILLFFSSLSTFHYFPYSSLLPQPTTTISITLPWH